MTVKYIFQKDKLKHKKRQRLLSRLNGIMGCSAVIGLILVSGTKEEYISFASIVPPAFIYSIMLGLSIFFLNAKKTTIYVEEVKKLKTKKDTQYICKCKACKPKPNRIINFCPTCGKQLVANPIILSYK